MEHSKAQTHTDIALETIIAELEMVPLLTFVSLRWAQSDTCANTLPAMRAPPGIRDRIGRGAGVGLAHCM
jgi:hypothetical protein